MPPTLVLIRHAQALHNVKPKDLTQHDPGLSDYGRQQATELGKHLQIAFANIPIDVIISSPMRRTLETCQIALDWWIQQGIKVEAHAVWQENYDWPSDTGTPRAQLAEEFPWVDFSQLDPIFPDKTSAAASFYHFTKDAILSRGQAALRSVYGRPEKWIIVMSHSGFLRTGCTGRQYGNADYRIFNFADRTQGCVDEPYRLVEHECTRENGARGCSNAAPVELGANLPVSTENRPTVDEYVARKKNVQTAVA